MGAYANSANSAKNQGGGCLPGSGCLPRIHIVFFIRNKTIITKEDDYFLLSPNLQLALKTATMEVVPFIQEAFMAILSN